MGEPASGTDADADEDTYGGIFGAFPYAFRRSESRLFRSYVVIGGGLAALVTLLFTFGLVTLVANTVGTAGGVFTFSRAFFIFVGMLVVVPLVAPVLSVARRHRRTASTPRYDAALALAGYLFVVALYLGLIISTPAEQQDPVSGPLAPVVATLYGLPRLAGLVPSALASVGIYLAHRLTR